jgi:site-specific DNA-methyltransferase (adenine-specific)
MKQGDIFQLGKHRLLCGDSTNYEQIRELMREKKADLVIADPPYNKKKKILNDKQKEEDFIKFNDEWIENVLKSLKQTGYCFIHGDIYSILNIYINQIRQLDKKKEINFKQFITWYNGTGQGHNQANRYSFATDCEYMILFHKFQKNEKPYFNNTWDNMGNVWGIHKLAPGSKARLACGGHPTPKPYKLLERQIKSTTKENGLVLDLFLGSGQTLLAAEELDRTCYGIELDPKWCNLIIDRWEKKTGKKAKKLN